MAKRARFLTLPNIGLEKGSRVPLCKQLYEALRGEIVNGRLLAGQRLPSSRVLAIHLSASRNTVLEAFERLAAEGYLVGRVGSGTRVARPQPHTYLSDCPVLRRSRPNRSVRQFENLSIRPLLLVSRTLRAIEFISSALIQLHFVGKLESEPVSGVLRRIGGITPNGRQTSALSSVV